MMKESSETARAERSARFERPTHAKGAPASAHKSRPTNGGGRPEHRNDQRDQRGGGDFRKPAGPGGGQPFNNPFAALLGGSPKK
jgi:hypothetical protein